MQETVIIATTQPSDTATSFSVTKARKAKTLSLCLPRWLLAVILLAFVRPELFGIPEAIAMFWKSWRGRGAGDRQNPALPANPIGAESAMPH